MSRHRMASYLLIGVAFLGLTASAGAQSASNGGYATADTPNYVGPVGPNVNKAFTGYPNGNNVQPGMDPGQSAYTMADAASGMQGGPMVPHPAMAPQPGLLTDPQAIRDCLCMQTGYEMLRNDVATKQGAYSQAQSQSSSLQDQITAAKGMASSPEQIDKVRELSQQRITLMNDINARDIPQLQQATGRYNQAVGQYQRMCGNKTYDGDVLARVKVGLTCQGG